MLGKIADHHSSFSQLVRDEIGGFVQTVPLFAALTLRDALADLGKRDVLLVKGVAEKDTMWYQGEE